MKKSETPIAILPAEKEMVVYRAQVSAVMGVANTFTVTNQTDMDLGATILTKIKEAETTITSRKELMTRPIMAGLASIRALFKPFEIDLAAAKKEVKEKMLAFQLEQDAIVAEEEARITSQVGKGRMKAETAVGKLATLEGSKVKSNTRTLRKLSIVDESLIPREYLTVNRELVTKALFEGIEVPGALLVEEKILVAR